MQSKAATVAEYLAELPAERRAAIEAIRDTIRQNLDPRIVEVMQYGMIGYVVPHSVYPAGYHCDPKQPLPFACVAAQKNYISIYLMTVYAGGQELAWFERAWQAAGKKLDMGKCCVRFKRVEDAALDVIGEAIRRVSVERHIAAYENAIGAMRKRSVSQQPAAKKPAAKKPVAKKPVAKKPAAQKSTAQTRAAAKRSIASGESDRAVKGGGKTTQEAKSPSGRGRSRQK